MADRMLTEQEAFRAARCFIRQFNEREKSDSLDLWLGWMEESTSPGDPEVTADPAQWHDWVKCVDQVLCNPSPDTAG